MNQPMVSIIALCYNHAPYLQEALDSIWQQKYTNLEIILIDDASTDGSERLIRLFLQEYATHIPIQTIFHKTNQGNCKSFNEGLALAKGEYIIDFALDDVLFPDRIAQQVAFFEQKQAENIGLVFTNAELIDEYGNRLGHHYPINSYHKALKHPPQGKVFRQILEKYFICPPTMMIKKHVLDTLGGYDETLAYEDFDLWVRASQIIQFAYLDQITTQYRRTSQSLSSQFYQKKTNPLLASTLVILQKAYHFCKEEQEFRALAKNAFYHQRQCLFTENFDLFKAYADFLAQPPLRKYQTWATKIMAFLGKNRLKLSKLYQLYKKLRYEIL